MKNSFILLLLFNIGGLWAQNNAQLAWEKAREAIELMDNGKIEESIAILKDCQKLDPTSYLYPYEIAYAHTLTKNYKEAIKILKKTKKYKDANSQVYQVLGNCYSYLKKPKSAIKEYEEGMKKFPNAGNLHLEKGNIYLIQENYNEAIKNYKNGIAVDPTYPSNYYRLALLYLGSRNKLAGLIYGELFMNLERTTGRTQQISALLYKVYQETIQLKEEKQSINFCDIVLYAEDLEKGDVKMPLCADFGKYFILTVLGHKEVNLTSLSKMRAKFLDLFFEEGASEHTNNVLFQYQKKMLDEGLFDAYNHYLFQMGDQEAFQEWKRQNEEQYKHFVDWYTETENGINITKDNKYIND